MVEPRKRPSQLFTQKLLSFNGLLLERSVLTDQCLMHDHRGVFDSFWSLDPSVPPHKAHTLKSQPSSRWGALPSPSDFSRHRRHDDEPLWRKSPHFRMRFPKIQNFHPKIVFKNCKSCANFDKSLPNCMDSPALKPTSNVLAMARGRDQSGNSLRPFTSAAKVCGVVGQVPSGTAPCFYDHDRSWKHCYHPWRLKKTFLLIIIVAIIVIIICFFFCLLDSWCLFLLTIVVSFRVHPSKKGPMLAFRCWAKVNSKPSSSQGPIHAVERLTSHHRTMGDTENTSEPRNGRFAVIWMTCICCTPCDQTLKKSKQLLDSIFQTFQKKTTVVNPPQASPQTHPLHRRLSTPGGENPGARPHTGNDWKLHECYMNLGIIRLHDLEKTWKKVKQHHNNCL